MSSSRAPDERAQATDLLAIGEVARRSGLAPSALRFYESRGLIRSERSPGRQRLYRRHVLRRLAVIRVAQHIGLTLTEIDAALATLPRDRAPRRTEWERLSRGWRKELDQRIATLEGLRDDLTGCIGCGCLSLQRCRLYNPDDAAAALGTGPRYLLGDSSAAVVGQPQPVRTATPRPTSRDGAARMSQRPAAP
jgi:MerR family transcriptional regulator, redox-sensitive transcriptional activator SoxR